MESSCRSARLNLPLTPKAAAIMAGRIVDVLVPVAVDRPYSYRAAEGLDLMPGDFVEVPLGNREVTGVIWQGVGEAPASAKLKTIIAKHETPPLPEDLR